MIAFNLCGGTRDTLEGLDRDQTTPNDTYGEEYQLRFSYTYGVVATNEYTTIPSGTTLTPVHTVEQKDIET